MDEITNIENEDFEEEKLIESPFKRTLMVLFSPGLVFKSLSVKSSKLDWIIPLTLSILVSLVLINAGYDYLRNDQYDATIMRIENNTNLTEEQKTAMIESIEQNWEKMAGFQRIIGSVSAVVGGFAGVLVIALVMLAVTRFFLHGKLAFGDAFRIGALGTMASLVGSIVKLPLIFYLESFMEAKTSLGLLFPESLEEEFWVKLLDIDVFVLWYVILICIGMSVIAKTSLKKAIVPMVILWFVFRIIVISITGSIGGLGM